MGKIKGQKLYLGVFAVVLLSILSFGLIKGNFFASDEAAPLSFEWLVEPKYDGGMNFTDGVAWVWMRGDSRSYLYTLIDRQGKILKENIEATLIGFYTDQRASFMAKKGGEYRDHWGYLNISGDVVIPPQYDWAYPFSSGMAAVQKNGRWGFIDMEGNIRVPLIYEEVTPYSGNLGGVVKNGKLGFVDKQGNRVVDFVFDVPSVEETLEVALTKTFQGVQVVKVGSLLGLIDENGKWIAQPEHERFYSTYAMHNEILMGAQRDGRVGFLNKSGDVVIDFQFRGLYPPEKEIDPLVRGSLESLYRFSEGLAVVAFPSKPDETSKDLNFGVINEKGALLFTIDAYPFGFYSEGFLFAIKKNQEKGFIDRKGKWFSLPSKVGSHTITAFSEIHDGTIRVSVKDESNKSYLSVASGGYKAGYLRIIRNGGGM